MGTSTVTVTPVTGATGADVAGVDLTRPLSNAQWDSIHQAFLDHQVLRFRGQHVSPAQHLEFARRFGPVQRYPYGNGLPDFPDVLEFSRNPGDARNFGGLWHSDTTYLPEPPMATMLVARELPPVGGDTLFANMYLAHETLSDGMQAMLADMKAVFSATKRYMEEDRVAVHSGNALKKADEGVTTEAVHPVVRTHPETGRKALYVNRGHTVRFDGWTAAESEGLLNFLFGHAERPEFQCRMNWEDGTLIVWDNRCLQHFAVDDYPGRRRVMQRVTIAGDAPA
ncbi:MAG: taurine dioxygenase [Rhodospirillales bacterium CG15_BIG_FIL_POST_REV_8_21_14_020_66_15]|nr:MAG: taurine dioxygenase [Rhodospirillales bacterium CG15_BIG_FIL_POST_REV_8_21_14_020_66_15]